MNLSSTGSKAKPKDAACLHKSAGEPGVVVWFTFARRNNSNTAGAAMIAPAHIAAQLRSILSTMGCATLGSFEYGTGHYDHVIRWCADS